MSEIQFFDCAKVQLAMVKKVTIFLALGAITLAATACNTVRGAGQDLKSAANAGSRVLHPDRQPNSE